MVDSARVAVQPKRFPIHCFGERERALVHDIGVVAGKQVLGNQVL
jgi:hypothetical protein